MTPRILKIVYIRPSRYDDDGYAVCHWRGVQPSSTLLRLRTLTEVLTQAGKLGPDINVEVEGYDDRVQCIPTHSLARQNRSGDTRIVVGFIGVRSNQLSRATDLALELRGTDVPVFMGAFHASGMHALFDEPSAELNRLMDHHVSLVRGEMEAPGIVTKILRDALSDTLQPIYDTAVMRPRAPKALTARRYRPKPQQGPPVSWHPA
jgi:hypothetical protein